MKSRSKLDKVWQRCAVKRANNVVNFFVNIDRGSSSIAAIDCTCLRTVPTSPKGVRQTYAGYPVLSQQIVQTALC